MEAILVLFIIYAVIVTVRYVVVSGRLRRAIWAKKAWEKIAKELPEYKYDKTRFNHKWQKRGIDGRFIVLLFGIGVLLCSCTTEITVLTPSQEWINGFGRDMDQDGDIDEEDYLLFIRGPQGEPGLDAFVFWRNCVDRGLISHPITGEIWPRSKISLLDYYDFWIWYADQYSTAGK